MISHLKQKTLVACPLAQSKNRVTQFMKDNGCASGSSLRIPLGFDLMAPGGDAKMRIDHVVALDLVIASRVSDLEARFEVEWKSNDGGPYPAFHGELVIENEDYTSFWLILEGTYEPPFGVAGSTFDAILGKRIAAQSARELLARMASSIEAGFQADEAAKPAAIIRSQERSNASV